VSDGSNALLDTSVVIDFAKISGEAVAK